MVVHDELEIETSLNIDVVPCCTLLTQIVIIRVINAFVLEIQVFYLVDGQVDNLDYEISLKWETGTVSYGPVIIELYEELIIFKSLNYSLDH
jgi:hypothetical protein